MQSLDGVAHGVKLHIPNNSSGRMKICYANASSALPSGAGLPVAEIGAVFKAKPAGKLVLSGFAIHAAML